MLAVILACGLILKISGRIYPNVSVCGVDVGGMGRADAIKAVQTAVDRSYGSETLTITLPDREISLRPDSAAVEVDTEKAVDDAMAYGRSGGPISAIIGWIRCNSEPHDVDISDSLRFDEAYLRDLTQRTANAVETELKQSEVTYSEEDETITVTLGTAKRELDPNALYDAIVAAYGAGQFTGTTFDYTIVEPKPVDLSDLYRKLCTPSEDASYNEQTHEFKKEVIGYGFDLDAEMERISEAEEGETIVIELGELLPEVTVDSLQAEYFSDTLASYDSPHTNIAARTANLILAADAIDGTILNPGEVFSFNKIVGERTAEKGYKAAIVYTNGGASEPELGGGVCQVASTIYMCALLADLDIVERTEHMYAVTYVPMGMDATIYWGSLDFKFKNSTAHPLLIRSSVSGGQVHVKLLGTNESDKTVKMTYTVLSTIPWEEVEKVDETKEPGFREVTVTPYTGYRVQTYKEYYDKNGEKLSTEKCAYSSYRKRDKVITVGPEETPPEEPQPVTDPVADPVTEPAAPVTEPITESVTPTAELPT